MKLPTNPNGAQPDAQTGALTVEFSRFNRWKDNKPKAARFDWRGLCQLLSKPTLKNVDLTGIDLATSDDPRIKEAKDGLAFSGAVYPETVWRRAGNYAAKIFDAKNTTPEEWRAPIRCNAFVDFYTLAILDFDGGATLAEIEADAAKLNGGNGVAACIYSTFRHTPEVPRFRLVIPFLTPVASGDYGDVWHRLAHAFGDKADRAAKDLARLHFLPACPKSRASDFIAVELSGAPLDVATLPQLPEPSPDERPPAPAMPDLRQPLDERAQRFALGALRDERAKMEAATAGQRHGQRLNSARALGGLVPHGLLLESEIFDALAVNFGGDKSGAEQTIRDGIKYGIAAPRDLRDFSQKPAKTHQNPPDYGDYSPSNEVPELLDGDRAPAAPRFNFSTLAQLRERPAPAWLITRLLTSGGTSLLTAKHASFKSFFALDMALSVATGRAWQGFDVARGAVVYIAAEGAAGLRKRADAWEAHHGATVGENFIVLDVPLPVHDARTRAAFVAQIAHLSPVLIVLDTLARCAVGLDENSSGDMGLFADALGALSRDTGAHVLTVHHNNKTGDYRGSSALPAAVDTHLSLERKRDFDGDGDAATLKTEKQKEFEELETLSFEARAVPLPGTHGAEHSLIFERLETGSGGAFSLSEAEQKILSELIEAFGTDGATDSQWCQVCFEAGTPKRTYLRAKEKLVKISAVLCPNKGERGAKFAPAPSWCQGANSVPGHLGTLASSLSVPRCHTPLGVAPMAPMEREATDTDVLDELVPTENGVPEIASEADGEAAGVDI